MAAKNRDFYQYMLAEKYLRKFNIHIVSQRGDQALELIFKYTSIRRPEGAVTKHRPIHCTIFRQTEHFAKKTKTTKSPNLRDCAVVLMYTKLPDSLIAEKAFPKVSPNE